MAAEVLSGISGALAQTFAPELIRNWNRQAVLAKNLRVISAGGQGAGQNVAWDVEFSGAGAARISGGGTGPGAASAVRWSGVSIW